MAIQTTFADRADGALVIQNEFACVLVEREEVPGGSLLRLQDMRTGNIVWIDPLELEAVTRLTRGDWTTMVDPSHGRASGDHEDEHGDLGG